MVVPGIDALVREASALREAGHVAEAIDAYERLLAQAPHLANSWYNLALLRRRARRPDAALAAYERALALGIDQPEEVHLNRGVIYSDDLRRPEAALAELQRALQLNPRFAPAWLNLGNLHEDAGQRDPARAAYTRLLDIDPQHAEALARLAGVSSVASADEALVGRLRARLAQRNLRPDEAATLGFALGRLLDGCAAYDAAFAAYAEANRASRHSAGAGYDRARHAAYIDALIKASPVRAPGAAAPTSSPRPLFICGMFRSGSTLAEQVLAGHPQVTPGGELDLLPALVRTLAPFPHALASADRARLNELADRYNAELARLFPDARIVTDKRPDNYLSIGLIKALFPAAKIIHTQRDALDNGLSIYFLHLAHSQAYATDLADIGHHYRQYRRLMAHWQALYPEDIFDLDYDRFVHDPRPELERLLAFCGLPWDESCLDFQGRHNRVKTASVWQVRQPLYGTSSGRWRHYAAHLKPLAEALGDARGIDQTS
jgi:tetratricopeptide (TPR) repeat protein